MVEKKAKTKKTPAANLRKQAGRSPEVLAKQMFEAGVHFGHRKSNWNPKMKPYIYGVRNNIHIIDLEKTVQGLERALEFIKEIKKNKGKILFIGTRAQDQSLIEELAKKIKMPYVIFRWIGGLLTNFRIIRKRAEHLIELEKKRETGDFKKYTKKEQSNFDKEIEKLKKKFEGIKELEKLPDAILVLNLREQMSVIAEARKKEIPIIALVDTNCDPSLVDYPIPSNDDAISALKFMLGKIEEAYGKSKSSKKT